MLRLAFGTKGKEIPAEHRARALVHQSNTLLAVLEIATSARA
jgi:hypothetical protein